MCVRVRMNSYKKSAVCVHVFVILRNCRTAILTIWFTVLLSHQQRVNVPVSPTLLPTQVLFDLKTKQNKILLSMVYFVVVLICFAHCERGSASFHVLRSFPIFFWVTGLMYYVLWLVVNMRPSCLFPSNPVVQIPPGLKETDQPDHFLYLLM